MIEKLNKLGALLHDLQMYEYLNEDSLPKIGEARGLVNELVKNCSIPDVSKRSDVIKHWALQLENKPMQFAELVNNANYLIDNAY